MSNPAESTRTTGPAPLRLEPVLARELHDGDTFTVVLPMGVLIPGVARGGPWVEDVRLAGVNAPELGTPDGLAAKQAVSQWLTDHGPEFRLHAWGREKYGRLLADLVPLSSTRPYGFLSQFVSGLSGSRLEQVHNQLVVPRGA